MLTGTTELSSGQVAALLEISHRQAGELMRSGAIAARRLPSGAWLTNADAVDRYRAHHRRGRGRQLDPATAWGVLWELSGLGCPWLSRATRSRVRRLIETTDADGIIRAVANRTRARRFTSHTIDTHVRAGLVLTGISAAHRLVSNRASVRKVVMGYIPADILAEHARRVEWTPDPAGAHVLFELNVPVPYDATRMPRAVIAADLAHSVDERDRALAISAMARIRTDWLKRRALRAR